MLVLFTRIRRAAFALRSRAMLLVVCSAMAVAFCGSAPAAPVPVSGPLVVPSASGRAVGFEPLTSGRTGIGFIHTVALARSMTNQLLLDGAGVALADVDRDGNADVFFTASGGGSQLWRNQGDWRFEDATSRAFAGAGDGVAGDLTGAAFGDLNGDGAVDLVVNSHGDGIRVFMNDGKGSFRRLAFPQVGARGGHSVAMADVDRDGWLDIYVCNYRQRALMDMPSARATFRVVNGVQVVATLDGRPTTAPDLTNRFVVSPTGGLDELGEPDVLYRNLGGTNLKEVAWTEGAFLDEAGEPLSHPPWDWGLAAQFCDVNGDGRQDLYVCNDFQSPDRFWLNESEPGRIRFRMAPATRWRHTSLFSMGVDFADINRDSRWDFVVLDMLSPDHRRRLTTLEGIASVYNTPLDPESRPQVEANTLFLQRSDGSFVEIANVAGVMATDWSWTPAFMDVDLDGWQDLLVTAGQERGSRDPDSAEAMRQFRRAGLRTDAQIFRERAKYPPQLAPLRAFRNRCGTEIGALPVFEDAGRAWGFDAVGVCHGMALGDLDGDGDLDVVINALNGPARVYRNVGVAPRIHVRLKGRPPNTSAVGAELRFWWEPPGASNSRPQCVQLAAGGRYLSSDAPGRTFACPGATDGAGWGRLEVRWPDGTVSVHSSLVANHWYEFNEAEAGAARVNAPWRVRPTADRMRPGYEARALHVGAGPAKAVPGAEETGLPRGSSTSGGAMLVRSGDGASSVWFGFEGEAGVRRYSLGGGGGFTPAPAPSLRGTVVSLAPWKAGVVAGLVSVAGPGIETNLVVIEQGSGEAVPVSGAPSPLSCVAVDEAGLGGRGLLFAGAGASSRDSPAGAPSVWMEGDGRSFRRRLVMDLGVVTGALFADIDPAPGRELITVSDWGSPKMFRCDSGVPRPWDPVVSLEGGAKWPLSALNGWWQCVLAGDFDGDGRADLVLGNWGLNSSYALQAGRPSLEDGRVRPLWLFHWMSAEGRSSMEAYQDSDGRMLPVHGLARWLPVAPWLAERFPTHRAFAAATLPEILGDRFADAGRLECRWLTSIILLNRGGGFDARALPGLAQLGPVFAWAAEDFDGDGRLDLYGAQGYFRHRFGRLREDAGEGVFLFGRGDGTFEPVSTGDLGFRLTGEQKSVWAGDVNGDRISDLLVAERDGRLTFLRGHR